MPPLSLPHHGTTLSSWLATFAASFCRSGLALLAAPVLPPTDVFGIHVDLL